jgi:hypothetical protein
MTHMPPSTLSAAARSKRSSPRPSLRLLCGLVFGALAAPAMAQSATYAEGLLNNSWVFNLGGFFYGTDLTANLNGQSTTNPEVDFDKTFGKADDQTRVRADVLWRITPAHRMRLMYFDNSVTRSRVLEEDVPWGDYTFNTGSRVDFKQEFKAINVAYEYAFLRRPTYELAASVGVHYLDFNLQLSGQASVTDANGNVTNAGATTKDSNVPAPLPMIGLRGGWAVSPSWFLDAQAQIFKLKYDAYDGNWSDVRLGATWMFHRNFGLGLAYNRFATRVDVEKDDFNGRLKLGYSGAQFFLTGTF